MKRANLIDRVTLLAKRRHALQVAARNYADPTRNSGYLMAADAKDLEVEAIKYATVAIRYLGGDKP